MKHVNCGTYREMSRQAAGCVAELLREKPEALLCFAAGTTPMGLFEELIQMQARAEVDMTRAWFAGLDEWVGLGPADAGSCIQVMFDSFYTPAGIPRDHIHVFDGMAADMTRECRVMEKWIADHGGIELTVLGIGMNGHIGFNEPGVPETRGCVVVDLDEVTKAISVKYFGKQIPVHQGVSIGMDLLSSAPEVILLADGVKKAPIVAATLSGPVTCRVPSSLLQKHPRAVLLTDADAAGLLPNLD